MVVRATELDGTVLNTSWDMLDASLKTPLNVTEKSANRSSRAVADLSSPVMSCSALGVDQSRFVMSLDMARADPPESSIATLIPSPDSLAISSSDSI